MLTRGKKIVLIIGGLLIISGGASFWLRRDLGDVLANSPVSKFTVSDVVDEIRPTQTVVEGNVKIPSRYTLTVPFTAQAPAGNWDMPYQEACEEASMLMVDYYYKHLTFTQNTADDAILKLIDWETSHGYGADLTLAQAQEVVQKYFSLSNIRVIRNPSVDDIKKEVFGGHPVIVPAAGRLLANPYFRNGGPFFHMLVVTGYNSSEFLTNDPGTKRGEGFRYKYSNLMDAMHDWTGDKLTIEGGGKAILVVEN